MRRFLAGVIGLIVGYLMLATCGYWAILMLSSNRFDRSLEAATTAAFVVGPISAGRDRAMIAARRRRLVYSLCRRITRGLLRERAAPFPSSGALAAAACCAGDGDLATCW